MDIHQLITAAVNNYRPNHGDFRVEEWDQKAPINDTPAESILAETPPVHDRVVLLRVVSLDVVIYRYLVNPQTGQPLKTDRDVELVKRHVMIELIPLLLAGDQRLRTALSAALAKRMYSALDLADHEAFALRAGIQDTQ